jgi:ribose 5-phosphate isomerase A
MSAVEFAKRKAAEMAVDEFIHSGNVIGIGSGSTIVYAIDRIAELCKSHKLENIICVPTSFQSRELLIRAELCVSDLNTHPNLDIAIDGADEVDPQLNCIKGGGGAHTWEKIVANSAKIFVIIADYRKKSLQLGTQWKSGIPIEIIPSAYLPISNHLSEKLRGRVTLRRESKLGNSPTISDNGNWIIDVDFGAISSTESARLATLLNSIPGIVCHGLFIGMAQTAIFGELDGSVSRIDAASGRARSRSENRAITWRDIEQSPA